jgi:RecB family endonuclease NucS
MRPIVARCEVRFGGRSTALSPESTSLLVLEPDGSVPIHGDAGGCEPLD